MRHCTGPLWGENQQAWQLFLDSATRSKVADKDKNERDLFDLDISVALELIASRELDPSDFEKIIQLRKGLNSG